MSKFSYLFGTALSFFRIGPNAGIKSNEGRIEIRNAIDSDFVGVKALIVQATGNTIELNANAAATGADHKYSIARPDTGMAAAVVLTLPPNVGTAGQILQTDGLGNLSYATLSGTALSGTSVPPMKITTIGTNTVTMPPSAIGFNYVLCSAGGGGGNGGTTIGGGGAAAGEFVAGNILIAELMSTLALTRAQVILTVTIGASVSIGERGNSSILAIGANTIAIAQGGFGGLMGTASQGWGPWSGGITYTSAGGVGQRSQRQEARLVGEPNAAEIVRLNLFGDGGNGGAINAAGLLGLPGYFSIQFF